MAAQPAVTFSQPLAMPVAGRQPHDGIKLAVQSLAVAATRAFSQTVSASGQREGP